MPVAARFIALVLAAPAVLMATGHDPDGARIMGFGLASIAFAILSLGK